LPGRSSEERRGHFFSTGVHHNCPSSGIGPSATLLRGVVVSLVR
jgi:hypothetical protein